MINVKTMAEYTASGEQPEVLFWVGCAGSFDDRAKKVTVSFASILEKIGIKYAILGSEESCTGDPAKRAGNEFLYEMMAYQNIQTMNMYNVKKIVTACPHCFNTLKNEYPELGGNYEVQHHTQFLQGLIEDGKIKVKDNKDFIGKRITYHDSCYMGRGNDIYEVPRDIIRELDIELHELPRSKKTGLCCGAGGAQMFKEDEKGNKRINTERADEILALDADTVVANCPFCITMLEDGIKERDKQNDVKVIDIVELLNQSI